jgi:DNA-binding transcriptional MerR regulator
MDETFKTEFVVKLFGNKFPKFAINRQTIYYWKEEKIITPSQSSTGRLLFSFTDLLQVRTIIELRESGISVKTIKKSIRKLRRLFPNYSNPLVELPLVPLGREVVVVKDGRRLRADTGQQYLFDISDIKVQLKRELKEFRTDGRGLRKREGRIASESKKG